MTGHGRTESPQQLQMNIRGAGREITPHRMEVGLFWRQTPLDTHPRFHRRGTNEYIGLLVFQPLVGLLKKVREGTALIGIRINPHHLQLGEYRLHHPLEPLPRKFRATHKHQLVTRLQLRQQFGEKPRGVLTTAGIKGDLPGLLLFPMRKQPHRLFSAQHFEQVEGTVGQIGFGSDDGLGTLR
jgi:hypothetical protein